MVDLTATLWKTCIESLSCRVAAEKTKYKVIKAIYDLLAFVRAIGVECALRMVVAMIDLVTSEPLVAVHAFEIKNAGKQLPEQVFPRHLFRSEADNKFVQLEVAISHVLSFHLTMSINENLSLFTDLPLPL